MEARAEVLVNILKGVMRVRFGEPRVGRVTHAGNDRSGSDPEIGLHAGIELLMSRDGGWSDGSIVYGEGRRRARRDLEGPGQEETEE